MMYCEFVIFHKTNIEEKFLVAKISGLAHLHLKFEFDLKKAALLVFTF